MRRLIRALCIVAPAILSGCMSVAYQSSLPARSTAHPGLDNGHQFTLGEIRIKKTWPMGGSQLTGIFDGEPCEIIPPCPPPSAIYRPDRDWNEEAWRKALLHIAMRRHPRLFTGSAGAIPLSLEIDARLHDSRRTAFTTQICTLFLVGTFIPVSITEHGDITVRIKSGNPADREHTFVFQRENMFWYSLFSPLALLPYPGRSDAPRWSATVWSSPKFVPQKPGVELTCEAIVEGLVRILEKNPTAFRAPSAQKMPPPQPSAQKMP